MSDGARYRRKLRDNGDATGFVLAMCGALILLILLVSVFVPGAKAAEPARRVVAAEVPTAWRIAIERDAAQYFGLQAQPARMAAQLHQESAWRPRAESPFAQGLAQFTPATARWLPTVCPEIGAPDVWSPRWSIAAQSCYMAWLYRRAPAMGAGLRDCDRWAYALRAYNGGEGWLLRERRLAQRAGAEPDRWRAVEPYRVRARWAHTENTEYPQRILLRIEPAYLRAGWTGGPACRD